MSVQAPVDSWDPALGRLLDCRSPAEEQSEYARLLDDVASPILERIVRAKLREPWSPDDREDVAQEARISVLTRLHRFRSEAPISSFEGYTVTVAAQACRTFLRKKSPARWSMASKLRYAVKTSCFSLRRQDDGREWIGLAEWETSKRALPRRIEKLETDPDVLKEFMEVAPIKAGLPRTLEAALRYAEGPIELELLVEALLDLLGERDLKFAVDDGKEGQEPVMEAARATVAGADTIVQQRDVLRELWQGILELSADRRTALLLNLCDNQEMHVLPQLPLSGIAGIGDIAAALGWETARLCRIWNDLPLTTKAIAAMMGKSDGSVSVLRYEARRELAARFGIDRKSGRSD